MNPSIFIGGLLLAVMVAAGASLLLLDPTNDPSPEPPDIAFDEEHERDLVRVESVSPGVRWNEVQVEISLPGGFHVEGGGVTRTHEMVFTNVEVDKEIEGGDTLQVCRDSPGEPDEAVEVELRHAPSRELLGSWALLDVGTCESLQEALDGQAQQEQAPEEEASEQETRGDQTPEEESPEEESLEEDAPEGTDPEEEEGSEGEAAVEEDGPGEAAEEHVDNETLE